MKNYYCFCRSIGRGIELTEYIKTNCLQRKANCYLSVVISDIANSSLFEQSIRVSGYSDANLRSHLGRAHRMHEVMYQSQIRQRVRKQTEIEPKRRRELHKAAIDCIIEDGRPLNDFRRVGMQKFLNTICSG